MSTGLRPRLKIAYSDFWAEFDPVRNFFAEVLGTRFTLELSEHPDILICSVFGQTWRNYSCPRILFTGENIVPDPRHFDASLSFSAPNETNYYLPLYRLYSCYPLAFRDRDLTQDEWLRKKNIGMVFSNQQAKFRTWSFHRLHQTFGVGSGGKAFNNVGGPVKDKGEFLSGYRFSVAFENTSWAGYTTEKLLEAHAFGTIPIYWGDPLVGERFNTRAFLSVAGKGDFPGLEGELRCLLGDYDSYRARYLEPLFPGNKEPEDLKTERIADFLEGAVARGLTRRHRSRVSDLQSHHWEDLWRYREWDRRLVPIIAILRCFTWIGYIKKLAKRILKAALAPHR